MSENVSRLLESAGISPTPQRMAVAEILLREPQHLTAEQVHARVNAQMRRVSVATVYNTLRLFTARGLLREVVVDPGRVFYDSTVHPHHHFYDASTGELTDIPQEAIRFQQLPQAPEGREFAGVDVVIRLKSRP